MKPRGRDETTQVVLDQQLLARYGVPPWFEAYRDKLRSHAPDLSAATRIQVPFEPARAEDVHVLPSPSTPEAYALETLGAEWLRRGKVAVVVLAGGMATRFGGEVKGILPVVEDKSFIELKLADARRAARTYGKPVPFYLMSSFATDAAIRAHLDARGLWGNDVHFAPQHIAVRLTREGDYFLDDAGQPSYYGPGHGDFFDVFRHKLPELRSQGVELILFSNVDNLGATVDARVIGFHVRAGKDVTVEVTPRWEGDAGGAPIRLEGRLELAEGFRLPETLDPQKFPISTNTMSFSMRALEEPIQPPVRMVEKKVGDKKAVQFETITCEATGLLRSDGTPVLSWVPLLVPRNGPSGRFFPVKTPEDLARVRGELAERMSYLRD